MHTKTIAEVRSCEWWQLYDFKSKNFYYYNVKSQITTWIKPKEFNDFDLNKTINLNALITNIIRTICHNIESQKYVSKEKFIHDIIDRIKSHDYCDEISELDEKELNHIDIEIFHLIEEIKNKLLNDDFYCNKHPTLLKRNVSNIKDRTARRIQPRTNPNYVNVDLIGDNKSQNQSNLIKVNKNTLSTYHFFEKTKDEKDDILLSKLSMNSLRTLSTSFIIFLGILRRINVKKGMISKLNINKFKKSKINKTQNQDNLVTSLSSILNFSNQSTKSDYKSFEKNVSICNLSSLMNKDKGKKLIKLSPATDLNDNKINTSKKQNQQNNDFDWNLIAEKNSFNTISQIDFVNNAKIHLSPSFILENSIKKMDDIGKQNLTNTNNINIKNGKSTNRKDQEKNIFNSISSSSITDIRNIYEQKNNQFNQKFQTLRRSLNNKAISKNNASYSESKKNITEQIKNTHTTSINNENYEKNKIFNESILTDDLKNIGLFQNLKPAVDIPTEINHNVYDDENEFFNDSNNFKASNFSFFSKKKDNSKEILKWSNQTIHKPLLKTQNKVIKKEACELFKLIQIYMGDRKLMSNFSDYLTTEIKPYFTSHKHNIFSTFTSNNKANNKSMNKEKINYKTLTQKDVIGLEIIKKGWAYNNLRDELFLQIIKQTSSNTNIESFMLGWQLMAICLSFFPPSHKLYSLMNEYIIYHSNEPNIIENIFFLYNSEKETNNDNNNSAIFKKDKKNLNISENDKNYNFNEIQKNFLMTAKVCYKRLQKINVMGAKKGLKSPLLEEVILSKNTISTPSLFGTSLEEIMAIQKRKFPNLNLPWIQTTLSEAVIRLDGAKIEGIFRVPGDLDEVNCLKVRLDQIWCSLEEDDSSKNIVKYDYIENINDPHLPASLLKLWYRELYEPLIPNEFYNNCIENCDKPENCIKIVENLPYINKLVFTYLIKFLKIFAQKENVAITKMDASNLSMIMAPNCLRCNSNEAKVIMENTKKEMQFIKTLIEHLDTSFIDEIK